MSFKSLLVKTGQKNAESFLNDRAPIRGLACSNAIGMTEHVEGNHGYLSIGNGKPLIFCPGLYGSIYNASSLIEQFKGKYQFLVPYLPLYDQPLTSCTVNYLGDYLESFVTDLQIRDAVFIGSSMGGGAILHYAKKSQQVIKGMILCGSSGLSTIPMQKGFFKRKDYNFIKQSTQDVFYNPDVPPESMIEEVFDTIQNYEVVLRSIRFVKSTSKDHMHQVLPDINIPTSLIWGMQDQITPPDKAELFHELLPDSELHFLNNCGHVPTQEKPEESYRLINAFLQKINY